MPLSSQEPGTLSLWLMISASLDVLVLISLPTVPLGTGVMYQVHHAAYCPKSTRVLMWTSWGDPMGVQSGVLSRNGTWDLSC